MFELILPGHVFEYLLLLRISGLGRGKCPFRFELCGEYEFESGRL